ncbi:MAG: hypothetical protein HZA08_07080 [Nitrospirae bacterium]|nr:hypothetical protein [Nitrospirota bacterium]
MAPLIPQPITDWRILSDTKERWQDIFGNSNAIVLEIGFGRGEFILEQARANPGKNYVGIELMDSQNQDKIESLIAQIRQKDLHNIRLIYNAKADIVIPQIFRNEEIKEIFINYPPPFKKPYPFVLRLFWPRERGGNAFAQVLYDALEFGGDIHIITDNIDYANEIVWNFESNITGNVIAGLASQIPFTMPDSYLNNGENRYYGQRYIHIRKNGGSIVS